MPSGDRTKFGPPEDAAILPWYEGVFTHAFVALNPFYMINGLNPAVCENGTLNLSRGDAPAELGLLDWMEAEAAKRKLGKEIDFDALDTLSAKLGKIVDWRVVCREAGFADHCELDRALRTNIKGLRRDFESPILRDRLRSYCADNQIFLPTEGRFEPVLQISLVELFRRCGHADVTVGDEFGDDDRRVPVDVLADEIPWSGGGKFPDYGFRRLFAEDGSLLVWVHWDSFYMLILGTASSLGHCKLSDLFEGFWCDEATTPYWLEQGCIPLVD